ncbi:MAG: Tim44 domain-containing protein [Thermodesulfobacteriota bacterium]
MQPSFLDLLLLGVIVFFAIRLFKGRSNNSSSSSPPPEQQSKQQRDRYDVAAAGWEHLRSKPAGTSAAPQQETPAQEDSALPEDFDTQEFLQGAKAVYQRLQEAWDERDVEDIRGFTTPDVFREIRRQAKEDPNPKQTEVVLLHAEVSKVRREGNRTHVSVIFDALLRDSPQAENPHQVREIWHFQRDESQKNSMWLLEGLEQLDPKSNSSA